MKTKIIIGLLLLFVAVWITVLLTWAVGRTTTSGNTIEPNIIDKEYKQKPDRTERKRPPIIRKQKVKKRDSWRDEDKMGAWVITQQFVEKQLRCPRTAKWTWGMPHVSYLGDYKYRIRHYVDAQNGFGALVRTHFTCTVMKIGEERWQLEELNFLEF